MAYITYYKIEFTNNLNEEVLVLIQKKDGVVDTVVQTYIAKDDGLKITCNTQDQGVFAPIITRELSITISLDENDIDYWDEFKDAESDTWKVIATINQQYVFHGYALPDEGVFPFLDKPIDATIKATDGLGLLKQSALINLDGNNFEGEDLIITYIAAALAKTNLGLNIRVYDDLYHSYMLNRDDDLKYDFFGQAKLEYRTFLKDAVEFVDCYEALKIILNRGYRLFYWNGEYIIFRMALYQYPVYVLYYTVYDSDGLNPVGYQELENYATVGKTEIIRAINEDAMQSAKFADKSVKTLFNYNIWPEIPKNNKFEKGDLIIPYSGIAYDEEDFDKDGNTTEVIGQRTAYTIADWEFGAVGASLPFALAVVNEKAYSRRITNEYGVELDRTIIIERPIIGAVSWLRSEAIPVLRGDRISFSCQFRFAPGTTSGVETTNAAMIYVVNNAGTSYYNLFSLEAIVRWDFNTMANGGLMFDYATSGSEQTEYNSVSVESTPIPMNGNLFIVLPITGDANIGFYKAYKDVKFEYKLFVAGGYIEVKGDYWTRSQTKSFPDKSEEEIFLSDNPHKIFKGCILDANGIPTNPDWYRMGLTESRHFKELINIGEYNLLYRRFLNLEGAWRATTFAPNNNQTNAQPIGFHKVYRQVDYAAENRQFILVCPWELNLSNGQARSNFTEVLQASVDYTEIVQTINIFRGMIVSAINNTTEAEWDSASGAPSPTIGFPPVAYVYPDDDWITGEPRSIGLVTNVADAFIVTGTGITEIFNEVIDQDIDYRLQVFQFADAALVAGNIYTFTIYGHVVSLTVGTIQVTEHDDGKLLGDSAEFKYQF